ncbi:MAG: P-loop NTPase fold protein [Acidaminococcaceae bacterium]
MLFASKRFDLLFLFSAGILYVYVFDGFIVNYFESMLLSISSTVLTFLAAIPIIFFVSSAIRKVQLSFLPPGKSVSAFFTDKAIEKRAEDKFALSEQANEFAEKVFNNGSEESLVFGVDAPWGTGKSTFINFCQEYWKEKHADKMIVYAFEPLRYEKREDLLGKFIAGLIDVITRNVFAPEIRHLVSDYAKYLKGTKVSLTFLGCGLSLPLASGSVDESFGKLAKALQDIDKKIIIIIDDLDRLDLAAITEVLFVVKKSFALPNISYILCYDTENISSFAQQSMDREKINEFLEKFINIKTSIYIDNKQLLDSFITYKKESLQQNIFANPGLMAKVAEGLKDIFSFNDFHRYLPFIGDARKLKILANTIVLLDGEKNDLSDYDFDKQDLTHLLLIYINYPKLFRKIYNAETHGKRGFFSLVQIYDEGYPPSDDRNSRDSYAYKNSIYYTKYVKKRTANQRFLLRKVFERVDKEKRPTAAMLASYACFNGNKYGGSRNLEDYLNLITRMSIRPLPEQYQFYQGLKNTILKGEKPIGEVLKTKTQLDNENNLHLLWRAIVNAEREDFTCAKAEEIIYFALKELPRYSLVQDDANILALREAVIFFIVKLLDSVGWSDARGEHIRNNDENISQIAGWIFGKNEHEGKGILEILSSRERGILGLYDLLLFRLHCCAGRGGDIFNVVDALINDGDQDSPTEGDVKLMLIAEMRKLSQKVFEIFNHNFVEDKINILEKIDSLSLQDVAGSYFKESELPLASDELEKRVLQSKTSMKAFIVYQLGSKEITNSGIGCGYYNLATKENENSNGEINIKMNEYLLEICFNPQLSENNYRHFVEYLMLNAISAKQSLMFGEYIPKLGHFIDVLAQNSLIEYWIKNRDAIKGKRFEKSEKVIYSNNLAFSYQEYLQKIYDLLDQEAKV